MNSKAKKSQRQLKSSLKSSEKSTLSFEELEKKVIDWGKDRLIFDQSTLVAQWNKLDEEHRELAKAIMEGNGSEVIDAIGDMMVVLTMIARMIGTNLSICYKSAYNEIKDRKGTMVNGLFVKE